MLYETFARGWENIIGRLGGPMSFRFLMQPAVAILFAVRAGLKDARRNEPPLLSLSHPRSWRARLQKTWKDVGKVFIVALILDSIYQVVVHAGIFTVELLITAVLLAMVPYAVLRDLVTRIATWVGAGKQIDRSIANDEGIGT